MTSKGIKKLRDALWKHNPHCYYCGKITTPVSSMELKPGDPVPLNAATLDHVYSINHPYRDREEYVLACSECNGLKSQIECQGLTLDVQREKAIKKLMVVNKMLEFEKE